MINNVVLVGRLTKDPELKYTQSGIASCRFTLAANRPFKNAAGEQEADFINCVTWRKTAENTANFLRKGSLAGIEGRIQTSNFEGKDGNRVFMTEIVADSVQFLEPKPASSNQSNGGNQSGQTNTPNQQQNAQNRQQTTSKPQYGQGDPFDNGGPVDISDDDLPF